MSKSVILYFESAILRLLTDLLESFAYIKVKRIVPTYKICLPIFSARYELLDSSTDGENTRLRWVDDSREVVHAAKHSQIGDGESAALKKLSYSSAKMKER